MSAVRTYSLPLSVRSSYARMATLDCTTACTGSLASLPIGKTRITSPGFSSSRSLSPLLGLSLLACEELPVYIAAKLWLSSFAVVGSNVFCSSAHQTLGRT